MNEKQVQEEFLTKFFHALQAGLDGLQTVRAAYDKRIAFSFSAMNFFDPDENKISEILAFFLNPTKFHGQKEVFLKVFLEAFCLTDALGLLATQMPIVERETRIDGDRRIDITIRFKSEYLIGIENKIGAADQPMQLFDYHKWLEKESNDRYTLFYLTRDGRNASSGSIDEKVAAKLTTSGKLQCVSYANHIIRLFEDFEKVCAADNVRAFIRDFTQYLKQRYIGVETAIELGTRVGGESGTTSFQRIAPLGAGSNTFS